MRSRRELRLGKRFRGVVSFAELEEMEMKLNESEEEMAKLSKQLSAERVKKSEAINKLAQVWNSLH